MKDETKSIPGFPGYSTTKDGRVFSTRQYPNGIWMKPQVNHDGYHRFFLRSNGKKWSTVAHRLVWLAWVGPIPAGKEINHRNGRKNDNRLSNLEVVTHAENVRHAIQTGLTIHLSGETHGRARLKASQVREIRKRYAKGGVTQKELANRYLVDSSQISKIVTRQLWQHV